MNKDNVELICNIGELSGLFREKSDIRGFLYKVVKTVAAHMKADVCSIYLYDEFLDRLILEATEGLNPDLIGKLILSIGEGLVGSSMKELRPILEKRGRDNPSFKAVPGSLEEKYDAFLAVPILQDVSRIGVLVLQHSRPGYFNRNDMMALKAIASQLATTLENAKLLMGVNKKNNGVREQREISVIRGRSIVEGIGIGTVYVLEDQHNDRGKDFYKEICDSLGLEDFQTALKQTAEQLQNLQAEMEERLSDVASFIFSTHLLMLQDTSFIGFIEDEIRGGKGPCLAVIDRVEYFVGIFSQSENPRVIEKVQDIRDLGHRILRNLAMEDQNAGDYSGQLVIARELLPSELVKITAQHVEGFVLYSQGASAHIAVLAKSLDVPMMYTEDKNVFNLQTNIPVILDGIQGNLLVDPGSDTMEEFQKIHSSVSDWSDLENSVTDETFTRDGKKLSLLATINLLSDISTAVKVKAEGIGLYRSEFPFIIRNSFPSEEEQFLVYSKIFQRMSSDIITLRTLDIGGDKILSYMPDQKEDNPFLGLRAIRFLLQNKKIFVSQLKAMLRAGQGRSFRIMFPMISSLDDFLESKRMVEKSREFLLRDGFECKNMPQLGVMVELPSAIEMAGELAEEADFISIGSNDLVQYLLGVDRTNEKVSSFYEARHPAVLRSIARVVRAAAKADCPLSLCGNMASDRGMLYFLVGTGMTNFSLSPGLIPEIQHYLNSLNAEKAKVDAKILLSMKTLKEVDSYITEVLSRS
ncbi:MAG: phosphoenolpyruvate--protein phosphotransferase [Spirochaetaceae bacterium 4572_59]|nr:MAG: phosphoenolpyruvate--protein phosphotransferase [Spirochaetaceae bacterium 4572_59]